MDMKVCHFSVLPPTEAGGVESVVGDLASALKKLGVDTKIIYGCKKYTTSFHSLISTLKIIRKRNDFDIIHTHGYSGFGLSLIPKIFKKSRHLITFHGTWINYYNVLRARTLKEKLLKFGSVYVEKFTAKSCDYGVAVSNYIKKSVVEQYGVDESKLTMIYNGVDCNKFKPKPGKSPGKIKCALWVGTNPELKGLDDSIKAVHGLPVKLMVAGISGKNHDNVIYLGKVKPDSMPDIYNKADFLLFPSKYEGFPMAVMEALASGMPVIVSPESHCEIIDERHGIITRDYRGAVEEFLKKDLVKMGGDCRQLAEKYDWSIQAKKYVECYKNVLH